MQIGSPNDAFHTMTKHLTTSGQQQGGDNTFMQVLSGISGSQQGEPTALPKPAISPAMSAAVMLQSSGTVANSEPESLLLSPEDYRRMSADGSLRSSVPSIAEFREKTGVDFKTAAFFLGGAIGRGPDMRDWTAIMSSNDSLAAARRATGQLLGPGEHSSFVAAEFESIGYKPVQDRNVVAQAGNFAVVDHGTSRAGQRLSLEVVDTNGHVGYPIHWNEASIRDAGRDFGIPLAPLVDLAEQLDAKGVEFRPGRMVPGTVIGADLFRMATSGQ